MRRPTPEGFIILGITVVDVQALNDYIHTYISTTVMKATRAEVYGIMHEYEVVES